MSLNEIINPAVPLLTLIPDMGTLKDGSVIEIRGKIDESSDDERVQIDLCSGLIVNGNKTDDKALHFNIRFDKKKLFSSADTDIVVNSCINNHWGKENRLKNCFVVGKPFFIIFNVKAKHYEIMIDGEHRLNFEHRLAPSVVQALFISGKVKINSVHFKNIQVDNKVDGQIQLDDATLQPFEPVSKPKMPFYYNLDNKRSILNKELFITLSPKMNNSNMFSIDLMSGEVHIFHCRVDLPHENFEGAIVRNNTFDGTWQVEERNIPFFPFKKGATNDVKISMKETSITLQVDGAHLANFFFRNNQNLNGVDTIVMKGDVVVNKFCVR
uniref:Galectin n=1 Tax=Rhabditophanes sp. KR3021 TaxID=114890 RepID=A0AC35UE37_9BILA